MKKPEKQELISIVVPVFNVEPYLRKCLDSICAQTYQFLDVVLVDDGSSDGSPAICDEYARKDPRFRVLHNKHEGLSAARNAALDMAEGAWIGFVDSDDWIEPDMYENLLKAAVDCRADLSYCGDRAESDDHVWGERMLKKPGILAPEELLSETLLRRTGRFNVWDKLYRTGVFEGIRFPAGKIYEDGAVFIPLLRRTSRIAYTGRNSYHYRIREGSILHSGYSSAQRMMNRKRLLELREDIRKYYPRQLPLVKYLEAFNRYQWIELYLRCGGDKKKEYRELRRLFLRSFPLLFCQDGVPLKDKCKAVLILTGLFVPVRKLFLRLFRKERKQ